MTPTGVTALLHRLLKRYSFTQLAASLLCSVLFVLYCCYDFKYLKAQLLPRSLNPRLSQLAGGCALQPDLGAQR